MLLPLSVALFFLVLGFWLHFNQVSAYTRAASVLSEWVGRTGQYDASVMCPAIRQTLLDQVGSGVIIDCSGAGNTNTFLQIVVLSHSACAQDAGADERCEVTRIGGSLPDAADSSLAECSGTNTAACPGGSSSGVGWTSEIETIARESVVVVDIWGARRSGSALFGTDSGIWLMPVGHAVSYVTAEQGL